MDHSLAAMESRAREAVSGTEPLPLAAPCRKLEARSPLEWLKLGWADLTRARRHSLGYGALMVILSYAVTALTWSWGELGLYLGLISAVVFFGPCQALVLYSISLHLERGEKPCLLASLRDTRPQIGNALVFSLILTVVFLVWGRSAVVIHIFFPAGQISSLYDYATFLGIGTVVGAFFSALVFAVSAFSLPMMMDREVDPVTAVVTSVNAVLNNKPAMLVWACLIAGCVLIGLATAFVGFLVLLPLLGHATWHGYRQTIDASRWPLATTSEPAASINR